MGFIAFDYPSKASRYAPDPSLPLGRCISAIVNRNGGDAGAKINPAQFDPPSMPRAETLLLSATRAFLDDAAQAVTQRCVQALPDLSRVVVLVPVLASASGVLRALGQAAAQRGHSSILPPRVTTLDAWAERGREQKVAR